MASNADRRANLAAEADRRGVKYDKRDDAAMIQVRLENDTHRILDEAKAKQRGRK